MGPATDPIPILPLHIDSTMMSCFRSCPQKFYREFICGLRPSKVSIDLHAGGCFSGTLEHFYRRVWECGDDPRVALDRSLLVFDRLWGDFELEKDSPKSKANMWAALEDYIRVYPPHSDHVQPFVDEAFGERRATFEFSFAIPLTDPEFPRHPSGDPFVYVGRADLLGRYQSRPVIRDEKTTARLDSKWSDHWNLRSQFLGYCWAARQGGLPVDTVVVRGIVINKTSIRQVEAIKVYSEHLIARWYEQLRRDLWRLRNAWATASTNAYNDGTVHSFDPEAFDFNLGETCTQYGLCPFMDLCQSPHPERWLSNYSVRRWNPLMRNPVDETSPVITPTFPVSGTSSMLASSP